MLTVPGPLPVAPAVMTIHDSSLAAVHAQPAPVDTPTEILPPFSPIPCSVGLIEKLQPVGGGAGGGDGDPAAVWVMVALCPAIETKLVRPAPPLAATDTVTMPAPLPSVGVAVIQGAPLVTVHEHAGAVDTVSVALELAEPNDRLPGVIE